jgi:hypothetical protein
MRGSEKTLVLKPPTHAVAIPWTTFGLFDWSKEKRTLWFAFLTGERLAQGFEACPGKLKTI